jgi:NADH:ubiquinone reductase (non-electrogenic)
VGIQRLAVLLGCLSLTIPTVFSPICSVLPGYPQEIRDFTLDHLQDIGIKVWTQARATKITESSISIYDKKKSATTELPYGLVVWATGVAPGELAKKLIFKLPEQGSYRSLKVDSRCEVIGGSGIFAVGDCADIDVQSEYKKKLLDLYKRFDLEFPGGTEKKLSLKANEAVLKELELSIRGIVTAPGAKIVKELYTRFEAARNYYLQNGGAFQGLTKEEVHSVVQTHMDRQKYLPPTAQVANQQGEYLAKLLNNPEINSDDGKWTFNHAEGFKFKNMGQLVYVGGHMAALSVPASDKVNVSWNGALTNYLWHAAYFGMLQSMSARCELVFDWTKSWIFGRSTALNAICTTDSASHVEALRRGGGVSRKRETCTTSSSSRKDQEVGEKTRWWRRWSGSNVPEVVKKKK